MKKTYFLFSLLALFHCTIQAQEINIIDPTPICAGSSISLEIGPQTPLPGACDSIYFELSDESGNWSKPYPFEKGSLLTEVVGTVGSVLLPDVLLDGNRYFIRGIPKCANADTFYSIPLDIKSRPQTAIVLDNSRTTFCKNELVNLRAVSGPATNFKWYRPPNLGAFATDSILRTDSAALYTLRTSRDTFECNSEVTNVKLLKVPIEIKDVQESYCANDPPSNYYIVAPGGDTLPRIFSPGDSMRDVPIDITWTEPTERYRLYTVPSQTRTGNLQTESLGGFFDFKEISIGFPFTFFGKTYDKVVATTLGGVLFPEGPFSGISDPRFDKLPNPVWDNFIALWAGAGTEISGAIKYGNITENGNELFVLHYEDVSYTNDFRGTRQISYQLVLHEASNAIEIQLLSCLDQFGSKYQSHIVGIEGNGPLGQVSYLYYQGTTEVTQTAVQFVPEKGCSCSVETIVHTLPTVTFEDSSAFCPTSPVTNLTGGMPEGGLYEAFPSGNHILDSMGTIDFSLIGRGDTTLVHAYTFTDTTGCKNTAFDNMYIAPAVIADWMAIDTCQYSETEIIDLSRSQSGELQFDWEIIPGRSFGNLPGISYVFPDTGWYEVSLSVYEEKYNCRATLQRPLYIRPLPYFDFISLCPPIQYTTQHFLPVFITEPETNSIFWDFGDDSTSTLFAPSHFYLDDALSHEVLLSIEDTFGCSNTVKRNIEIITDFGYELGLYPNPTTGIFHINAELRNYTNDVEVRIYGPLGNHIKTQWFEELPQGFQRICSVDLTGYALGVYTVLVFSNGQRINLVEKPDFYHANKKQEYFSGKLLLRRQ